MRDRALEMLRHAVWMKGPYQTEMAWSAGRRGPDRVGVMKGRAEEEHLASTVLTEV